MTSIVKDNHGKYICENCRQLVVIHDVFGFVCKCNEQEVREYNFLKSQEEKIRAKNKGYF